MSDIIVLIYLIGLLLLTYITGSIIEKNHFHKIKKREKALVRKPIVSYGIKKWDDRKKVKKVELVAGEVVIAGDYFKNFVASIKNIFGGRLTSFESILDRGRREAILRMREKALNANVIVNMRIEMIMLNEATSQKQSVPQCAVIAYGTAITYE